MQDQLQELYGKDLQREDEEKAGEKSSSACPPPPEPIGAEQSVLVPAQSPKASESFADKEDEKGELAPPELKFCKWPTPHEFLQWLHTCHMQISHAARNPDHAYKWIKKVTEVSSYRRVLIRAL